MQKNVKPVKRFLSRYGVNLAVVLFVATLALHVFFPSVAEAFVLPASKPKLEGRALALAIEVMQNETRPYGTLPLAEDGEPVRVLSVPVTAYSSEVGQTDSTPFITASGTSVRRGVIAANFLPIGTRVRFPDLYGDEVFVVEDRMNARYWKRVDIWMEETADAKNFGLQHTTIEVF